MEERPNKRAKVEEGEEDGVDWDGLVEKLSFYHISERRLSPFVSSLFSYMDYCVSDLKYVVADKKAATELVESSKFRIQQNLPSTEHLMERMARENTSEDCENPH